MPIMRAYSGIVIVIRLRQSADGEQSVKALKRFGAPPKREPKPGERFQLRVRVTPELKRCLDAAAEKSGRSQCQEAELRLERSFEREDLLIEALTLAYGGKMAGCILMM